MVSMTRAPAARLPYYGLVRRLLARYTGDSKNKKGIPNQMKTLKEAAFLKIIEEKGILQDSKYPQSAILSYHPDLDLARFWTWPGEAHRIPFFVEAILDAFDEWESIYIWRHLGSWSVNSSSTRITDEVQSIVYQGAGIKDTTSDILHFERSEFSQIVTLIFNQIVFGWNVGDDIYFVPGHGKQFAKTDHHDVVHVKFKEEVMIAPFIEAMKAVGFELPDDAPDETFKKPDWM